MDITSAALAIAIALSGAACYAVGAALQQHQASSVKASTRLDPGLLVRLVRRPAWLAGIAANAAGAGLHVVALSLAPIAFVQPVGVMTVVFAVPAGALLRRRRPRRGELAGAVVCSAALALLVSTLRAPDSVGALLATEMLPLVGILALVLGVGTLAARALHGPARTVLLATSAGVAFGITSALVRLVVQGMTIDATSAVVVICLLAFAAAGLLLEQSAFQTGRLGLAVAVVAIADPLTAVTVGAGLLHQPVQVVQPVVTVLAALAVIAGVAVLARRVPHPFADSPGPHAEMISERNRPADGGLRILIGTDTYPPNVNGAAYYTRRLALGLAARGHEVHVVCPSATGESATESFGTVYVHRVKSIRTPFHAEFRVASPVGVREDVTAVLERVGPDVVHVQGHFLVGRVLCRLAGRRGLGLVATNHFMPDNLLPYLPLPSPIARVVARLGWHDLARVFAPAQALTTPTPTAAKLLQASVTGKRVEPLSNGIDLARFGRAAPSRRAGPKPILFVGRLDAEKHVGELIDALPAIRTRIDAQLVIAGIGKLRESLEQRAVERGVAEHVHFLGFVADDDLPGLYASADVFCMPGTAELQSLATLEAMATGCPVVAANAMALPHLCQHGRNGFGYEPHDIDELARRVIAVLGDHVLREQMSNQSRTIAAEHDEAVSLRRFEEIYADVINAWTNDIREPAMSVQ
jgi:glycosyltransferase involved in cell wall biosynthesis/drug/metabolite transporter (DMT)-like permease